MRRTLAALLCAVAGLTGVGCGSLKYEERTANGGVISFKAGERESAIAQLKKDYGDVAIEAEYDPKGSGNKLFDPNAPVKPGERMVSATGIGTLFTGSDEGKMHIKFSKTGGTGTTPPGLPPAPTNDGLMQAGYRQVKGSGGTTLPPPDMTGTAGTK